MQAIKDFFSATIGFAIMIVMLLVSCMIGVIPLMIGIWMWHWLLG